MNAFLLGTALFVGLLILVGLHRINLGPTIFDRAVAAALVSANGMVVLLVVSFLYGWAEVFVDIALSYALLAFVVPIAFGKYFERKRDP